MKASIVKKFFKNAKLFSLWELVGYIIIRLFKKQFLVKFSNGTFTIDVRSLIVTIEFIFSRS